MLSRLRNKILAFLAALCAVVIGYLLWSEMMNQNKLRDLDLFCANLKLQTPMSAIEISTTLSPGLRMILLDADENGTQIGSIYFEGSGRWACSVTFMRGRLTRKSYGSDNLARNRSERQEKLKPW
jgi:hypothetical protein